MKLLKNLSTIHLLLIGILLFILLRTPSLFEPHWYGDEGIYATVAQEMSYGETLYKDIWDNRTPVSYYIYMISGNSNRFFFVRLLNLLAGIVTIIGIYKLAKKIVSSKAAIYGLFTSIFLLGLPIFEGNIANGENFFLPFTVWGIYLGLSSSKKSQIFSGILLGVATMIKIIALFDFLGLLFFLVVIKTKIFTKKVNLSRAFSLIPHVAGFCLPIAIICLDQILKNNFTNFIQTTLLDMFAYVGYSGNDSLGLIFFQNSLKLKLLIFIFINALLILNLKSKRISKNSFLISIIFVYEYFATITSSRHYTHYLLQLVPGLALFTAIIIKHITLSTNSIRKINLTFAYLLTTFLCIINFTQGRALAVYFGGGNLTNKMISYYRNFVDYKLLNKTTQLQYNQFFNNEETVLLEAQDTIKKHFHNEKRIYIYSDKAWLYDFLDIRVPTSFCVSYHRYLRKDGNSKLIEELKAFNPSLIIMEKNILTYDKFDELIDTSYREVFEDTYFQYYQNIE